MAGYKAPSFQERIAGAAKARSTSLDRLKEKPSVDPAAVAQRIERAQQQEAARAQRAAERAEALQQAKEEKLAKKLAANLPEPTEADRKAARDARYAARKARVSSR